MKISCPVSCFLLLSFGACFPPDEGRESRYPGRGGFRAAEAWPGLPRVAEALKWRRSPEDLHSPYASIAKGLLQGVGKERPGVRFQRQQVGQSDESEAVNYLPQEDGQKRGGTLGSLAEELNGYNRKKGGFSFRFGRGRRTAAFF
ncbi:orexigenic neuropeptide QRFP [Elgaria multicarinata webbii]|uniref:orexigenic neuropeptide QRFP n=1 Tax=Elgaria multicarinata webbii TaxID=159646 RepID=UPI002FCD4451